MCLAASNLRKIRAFYLGGQQPVTEPKPRPTKNGYTRPPSWVTYGKRQQYQETFQPDTGPPGEPVPNAA